jgi:hypothetical protein
LFHVTVTEAGVTVEVLSANWPKLGRTKAKLNMITQKIAFIIDN